MVLASTEINETWRAITEWEQHTCLRFRVYNNTEDIHHVVFTSGRGCSSYVGRQYKKTKKQQEINLGEGCRNVRFLYYNIVYITDKSNMPSFKWLCSVIGQNYSS